MREEPAAAPQDLPDLARAEATARVAVGALEHLRREILAAELPHFALQRLFLGREGEVNHCHWQAQWRRSRQLYR
jgi:hypothetical protein